MYEGLQNISWGCLLVDENVNTAFLIQQKVVVCSDGKNKTSAKLNTVYITQDMNLPVKKRHGLTVFIVGSRFCNLQPIKCDKQCGNLFSIYKY
jgi:hypothetical protein